MNAIFGMAADIRRATTLDELRALANLESEYPHVFVPSIRALLGDRLMNWVGRKPYRQNHKPITGRPRKTLTLKSEPTGNKYTRSYWEA